MQRNKLLNSFIAGALAGALLLLLISLCTSAHALPQSDPTMILLDCVEDRPLLDESAKCMVRNYGKAYIRTPNGNYIIESLGGWERFLV